MRNCGLGVGVRPTKREGKARLGSAQCFRGAFLDIVTSFYRPICSLYVQVTLVRRGHFVLGQRTFFTTSQNNVWKRDQTGRKWGVFYDIALKHLFLWQLENKLNF